MITFEKVLKKLKSGKILELKFRLLGGLYSRHELQMKRNRIVDHSFVDDSTTHYTVEEYKKTFYGEAFRKNAVELLEET